MESPTLKKEHWRKSGQWFVLNRRHVQIVVNDTEVAQAFKEYVRCSPPFCSALQRCALHWVMQHCMSALHASLPPLRQLVCSCKDLVSI